MNELVLSDIDVIKIDIYRIAGKLIREQYKSRASLSTASLIDRLSIAQSIYVDIRTKVEAYERGGFNPFRFDPDLVKIAIDRWFRYPTYFWFPDLYAELVI